MYRYRKKRSCSPCSIPPAERITMKKVVVVPQSSCPQPAPLPYLVMTEVFQYGWPAP